MLNTQLTKDLNVKFPIIMAPMFLVSNSSMVEEAMKAGIIGTFPTLNYRDIQELDQTLAQLTKLNETTSGTYGVNLIVQKSNIYYEKHLEVCVRNKVPFYITSLGNPSKVINEAKKYGAKVYCDVTNLTHAKKAKEAGCDGFIAVGQGAGGHAGPNPLQVLIPRLKEMFPDTPVIAAGGISNGLGVLSTLSLGAAGVSIGTLFITSEEATVSNEYKKGIVGAEMEDIVMTERLSGTPASVINTKEVQKMGLKQSWIEQTISNNKTLKKYFKMIIQYKGMKKLQNSIKPGNYSNIWSAGKSSALIHDIKPCKMIIEKLLQEVNQSKKELDQLFK